MFSICREHKRHINKDVFYQQNLFNREKVWVRRTNKRKMNTLYHGPYTVVHASEHSMRIEKKNGVAKGDIKIVKAFVPRNNLVEENLNGVREHYNFRPKHTEVNYFEYSDDE